MSVDSDHDTSADVDQEWELQHQLVSEAVRFGLETSFREPILEAVRESGTVETREDAGGDTQEATADVEEPAEESDSSRTTTVAQGLVVFVVMFVVLYVALRKLTGEDAE